MTELTGRPQLIPGEIYYYGERFDKPYVFIGYMTDGRYVFELPEAPLVVKVGTVIKDYGTHTGKSFVDNLTAHKDMLILDKWYVVRSSISNTPFLGIMSFNTKKEAEEHYKDHDNVLDIINIKWQGFKK